ncbi:MAG TPA: flagellar biosynthetic protein FliR [Acetobacteraceae bacterium]|nr:flagellar biosynthetic protein FliR [Acetobacteraceae bacterium]
MALPGTLVLPLSGFLSISAYRMLLVFARVSAAFLMVPGFGEPGVPVRVRILAGLGLAATISSVIPGMPTNVPGTYGILLAVAAEVLNGALLGTISRVLMTGLLIGGQVAGQAVGLSNIFVMGLGFDQSATIGAAFYAGFLAVLFATDGHHLIIRTIADSYTLMPPGLFPDMADDAHAVVAAALRAFRLAAQLGMPFLVLSLMFNVSLAGINKALPAMPVFMIGAPAIVMAGLYLMTAVIPGVIEQGMLAFTDLASVLR